MTDFHARGDDKHQYYHPINPDGATYAEYPHFSNNSGGRHVTDVVGKMIVSVPFNESTGLFDDKPSRQDALSSATNPPSDASHGLRSDEATFHVRGHDKKKDESGKLKGRFYEPVSPRSMKRDSHSLAGHALPSIFASSSSSHPSGVASSSSSSSPPSGTSRSTGDGTHTTSTKESKEK
ncbi:hypothetical protein FNU76_05175 [Chitinimonas arctica]|uniref:Uncharacterized protein n=1 Tax=Chitinimonas arctica TaxID=2594795 RepID=A0A516SCB8_9NEIS|nr:hypothetical protein [Chitinimonas arctica]QDQ25790.1 hypothetical protein FNU76_05175 [Chitinimonas arctica]